jgi:REP element-mobilizing transposase RayT
MPRLPRYFLPGVPQYVIQCRHNRQPIFFHEDDYCFYLECLQETISTERKKSRIQGADACSQGA